MSITRAGLLASLPSEWPHNLLPQIQEQVTASGRTLVVLDDDPTGTQTVHGVPVLTEWSTASLEAELRRRPDCFYVLTNSRSLPPAQAESLNAAIGRHLTTAANQARRGFAVVSRSDSTLRGHFPGEVDALAAALGHTFDAWLICPYFREGGRYTVDDVHYVAEGQQMIPAAQTPYAQDSAFGYRASNLREWVAEKTANRIPAADVASISLTDIRIGGPERVTDRLLNLPRGAVCVINAASYRDLEVVVAGLLAAEEQGRRYLYRTAASFVRVRAGITPRELLSAQELDAPGSGGGLFVAGSYVPKTTAQLNALLEQPGVVAVELNVLHLLDESTRETAIYDAAGAVNTALGAGQDVVLFTSRDLVTRSDAESALAIGRQVSDGLIAVVHAVETQPRYLVAKGGITSSDVATRGLNVRRAEVMGQILPGVPVWKLGPESRYPGSAYIVFPGNVGDTQSLAAIRNAFQGVTSC
ncbi:MAG: hypothetical protein GYB65_09680 [Chloroflexi bacterium]|nr:hypothetical protein [Chloroflexota bacterium]